MMQIVKTEAQTPVSDTTRGIYSYQKLIFFPNQVKLKVDFFSPFSLERWAGALPPPPEDRLGYPAISMNFKTESFTYM